MRPPPAPRGWVRDGGRAGRAGAPAVPVPPFYAAAFPARIFFPGRTSAPGRRKRWKRWRNGKKGGAPFLLLLAQGVGGAVSGRRKRRRNVVAGRTGVGRRRAGERHTPAPAPPRPPRCLTA